MTEARDRDVYEPRVHPLQHFPADAEPIHDAGAQVFDQDVGLADQFLEDALALRVLQVERDALLVAVGTKE